MYMNFKQMLLESTIEQILRKEYPEIRFNMSRTKTQSGENDWVELSIIVVQFDNRNSGHGSEFMKRFIELADQDHVDIFLTPDDSYSQKGEMNKSQLIKWYKKFGFEKKHKDDFRAQYTHCYYNSNSI